MTADPFVLQLPDQDDSHLFFEVWDLDRRRGVIAHAYGDGRGEWSYDRVVLAEPWHLSYPHVFAWNGEIWMIPESRQAEQVNLYRAEVFPHRWTRERTLLHGYFADSTIVHQADGWYLFSQRGLDELTLHVADCPLGPWRPHPCSPIRAGNRRVTRPAGPILNDGARRFRVAQDGLPSYGFCVRALELLVLDPEHFEEREIPESPVLRASGRGWNCRAMHHLDARPHPDGGWWAVVDGADMALW